MPYRVLVVEDHPVMREAYARLLDREAGPLTDAAALPDGRRENGGETGLGMVDASVSPEVAVALGLGCGDYSEAILGAIGQS